MEIQWSLVVFSTLAGGGAWLFFLLAIDEIKGIAVKKKTKMIGSGIALAMLLVGALFSVTHLAHPDRILAALGHPTAGIFMEALFVGLLSVAIIIYMVMVSRETSAKAIKVLAIVSVVIALVLVFVLGFSYIIPARPQWGTITLPLCYAGTSAAVGAAVHMVLAAYGGKEEVFTKIAAIELAVAGALSLVTALAYGAASGVIAGDLAFMFWSFVIVCGAVVPLVCGIIIRRNANRAALLSVTSVLFSLVGCIGFRCVMWLVGVAVRNYFGMQI